MTTYTITEARPKLGDIVRRAAAHQQTVITDHDQPIALVVNFSDWEDMEDTIAALRNQISRAQGVQPIPHEEAKRLLRQAAADAAAK
ncbi:type II toxin-antitoxin system Phd/YefM family antitoxin [Glycomyces sp. A-F 0318]|uniref:type II toxin-antitoxin system Phd/YefM family antitoxin n=1 Tax=Glycomyces amatae TaxID=2881355 RepID=UPI001E2CBED6|nr:type II toxin-antitoxin system Phd/YefM family antitoxin [Glycomyces amatae]MCD0445882.1 type II toxin-antitoxin system Phd/YefM family antitoxin [Glycomyces amatae]